MDRKRFEQVLDAYGADPKRWPEAERAEADAFRAAHPDIADALVAQARTLDGLLDTARDPARDTSLLAARILKQAPVAPAARSNFLRPAIALAACAVFGIVLGFGGGMLAPHGESADAALTAAFGDWGGGEG